MPRSRLEDLYPEEEGLTPEDLRHTYAAFVTEAQRLQTEFRSRIALLIGFETEVIHEHSIAEVQALWRQYPLDYMVGSVHHVGGTPIDFSLDLFERAVQEQGGRQALFAAYFDAQYELLQHVRPAVVGHFDLIKMYCPTEAYSEAVWAKIDRNITLIAQYGGMVELNSRAYKKKLPSAYPMADVLARMKCAGVRFTLSDDSHGHNDLAMQYSALRQYMEREEISRLYCLWPRAPASTHPSLAAISGLVKPVDSQATLGDHVCIVEIGAKLLDEWWAHSASRSSALVAAKPT